MPLYAAERVLSSAACYGGGRLPVEFLAGDASDDGTARLNAAVELQNHTAEIIRLHLELGHAAGEPAGGLTRDDDARRSQRPIRARITNAFSKTVWCTRRRPGNTLVFGQLRWPFYTLDQVVKWGDLA